MQLNKFVMTFTICAFSLGTSHAANLSGKEIATLVSGKKVTLSTSWGAFPLRYGNNKRVTGDGSGLGLAKFFAPKETGRWWVASNQLCQRFPTWYKGKTYCFSLQKTGSKSLKWKRNDGYSGTARIN